MHLEAQTKRIVQTALLFSASSLCAILLFMAATRHAEVTAPSTGGFQVYTYQNPFDTANTGLRVAAAARNNVLGRLAVPGFIAGVLSLGILWLASGIYLQRGKTARRHMHRKIIPVSNPEPKMNPLAILPLVRAGASNKDISRQIVFGRTTTLCSVTHRRVTAPCQTRFRPVYLVAHQQRFQRL